MSIDLAKTSELIVKGSIEELRTMTGEALDAGKDAGTILNKGLLPGMDKVGELWRNDEIFMPEVLRSAKAMSKSMELLRPHLTQTDISGAGKLVIGTVDGDLHDIGKDLAGMMFEGGGYEVINLGTDQPNEAFVNAVSEHKPDLLGMSALLTTTMPRMGEVINSLKEAGIRDQVNVIIGGAPVTQEFADEIGADLYSPNAGTAVELANEHFNKKS